MTHSPWSRAGLVLLVLTQAACYESQYVHTVVHPDGSVDRSIVQSPGLTPDAARRPGIWRDTRMTKVAPDLPWDGSLTALVPTTKKEDETYFAATGHFPSVAALPDHYAEQTADGNASSRLVRSYTSRDLGLVTEHVWTETLTDIVGPDEARRAREEWAAINERLLRSALDEGLGPDYEYSGYVDWVSGTMRSLASAFLEARIESRARAADAQRGGTDVEEIAKRIAARKGLAFEEGALETLIRQKTSALVHRRDGRDLDPALIKAVARGVMDLGDGGAVFSGGREGIAAGFKEGRDRVIDRDFGGPEAFAKRMKGLLERALGIGYDDSERTLHFELTLPGIVVETNGTLWGEGDVAWAFKLDDAALFGYTMRCRSLEADAAGQRAVLAAEPVTSRNAELQYMGLVESAAELRDIIERSVRERSGAVLQAYRAAVAPRQDPELTDATERLATLLGLPALTATALPSRAGAMTGVTAPALRPPPGARAAQRWVSPTDGRDMVWAPPGTFRMGGGGAAGEARPLVERITRGFWIDADEVSAAAYRRFLRDHPEWRKGALARRAYVSQSYLDGWTGEEMPAGREDLPVTGVSWFAARAYCASSGKRLPTEAEWEYAAQAGASQLALPPGSGDKTLRTVRNAWGLADLFDQREWTSTLSRPSPYRADDGREDDAAAGARVVRTLRVTERRAVVPDREALQEERSSPAFRCAR
jgi:formylglycine-generating enzyme required for sulfatase activity